MLLEPQAFFTYGARNRSRGKPDFTPPRTILLPSGSCRCIALQSAPLGGASPQYLPSPPKTTAPLMETQGHD
jgi:hypothetical protein